MLAPLFPPSRAPPPFLAVLDCGFSATSFPFDCPMSASTRYDMVMRIRARAARSPGGNPPTASAALPLCRSAALPLCRSAAIGSYSLRLRSRRLPVLSYWATCALGSATTVGVVLWLRSTHVVASAVALLAMGHRRLATNACLCSRRVHDRVRTRRARICPSARCNKRKQGNFMFPRYSHFDRVLGRSASSFSYHWIWSRKLLLLFGRFLRCRNRLFGYLAAQCIPCSRSRVFRNLACLLFSRCSFSVLLPRTDACPPRVRRLREGLRGRLTRVCGFLLQGFGSVGCEGFFFLFFSFFFFSTGALLLPLSLLYYLTPVSPVRAHGAHLTSAYKGP